LARLQYATSGASFSGPSRQGCKFGSSGIAL
jgi:hypothetical protein